MGTSHTVKITDLTLKGNGIATGQSHVYEVPFTLPEEVVEVSPVSKKGRTIFALPRRIVKQSPLRKNADCEHYGTCGACHYRHVSYNKSIQIKEALFYRELEKSNTKGVLDQALAGVKMVAAPNPKHYRNNVRFYVQDKKLMQHKMLTHDNFEVRECFVVNENSWQTAQQWKWKLPKHVQEVEIRENEKGEQMCIVSGTTGKMPKIDAFSVYFYDIERKTFTHLSGAKTLRHHMEVAGQSFSFEVGPDSFFQVHTAMAELLYQFVFKVTPHSGKLYDLYSGTGTIGITLARLSPELQVTSMEINEEMVAMAKHNAAINAVTNISFHQEDVRTATFNEAPDSIIVDPPRNGLEEKSLQHMISIGAQQIVYVSCNPQTFLRDMQFMLTHYDLKMVRLFDMMPFTSHMEVVGVFEKR